MFTSRQRPPLRVPPLGTLLPVGPVLVPASAGGLMLAASFLPWLNDPLGSASSAWGLPIDIGWQFHSMILSYGLMCFCCALSTFFLACMYWRRDRAGGMVERLYLLPAGMLCFLPIVCFCVQYLCTDTQSIEVLAQHKIQMLLVQQHFGYKISEQFIQQQPLELTTSTLAARFALLINEVSAGVFVSCMGACLLIGYYFVRGMSQAVPPRKNRLVLSGFFVGMLLLARGPLAMGSNYEAKVALAAGSYATAIHWLDAAAFFNPALEQVSYYHIQRGQAQYFLTNGLEQDDSHEYLAFVYREQGDYLDAYQELQAIRGSQPGAPTWIAADMSATLTQLAEATHRRASTPLLNASADTTILPWLQTLLQVDSKNVYGQYVLGRIHYDLHNYPACIAQMTTVLQISGNADVQSSAYTYIALSLLGQGRSVEARQNLLKAIALDPYYHNNIAREELSGLH